jgi:integrase/recombinase XerD
MGRQKKVPKPKEPVRIRQRKLKNGNISLYLDIYSDGVRKYESLSLYLVPEKDPISKDQNRHAMQVANKVKSERILGLQNRGIKQWEKIKQENMPLLTWLCKYEESDGNFAKSTLKGRKEMRHKIEQYLATTGDINICLSEIDVDFCRGFVKFLKTAHHGVKKDATAVISQGCAHHHQAVFNGALNKAVREGIIARPPIQSFWMKAPDAGYPCSRTVHPTVHWAGKEAVQYSCRLKGISGHICGLYYGKYET